MSVGVVLGAGGPLGWAYHLGVIEGVREAIGREPANADRIVGTSAGAAIAATLLTGTATEDVLALITTPPSGEEQRLMRSAGTEALRHPLRSVRPVAPGLVRHVGRVGVATALVGLLPGGLFPTLFLRRFTADVPWPDQLWIPSVRIDDGRVVVFGRDPITVTLGDAVEATQAVPGLFRPKVIDGARYVDGAVASSTHADTLVSEEHDVVLVSAPMTRPGRGPIRVRARRRLDRELEELRRAGSHTVVLRPDDAIVEAAEGFPRGGPAAGADIVDAARRQTVEAFRRIRRV
ncbi:MAG: patatin-like phospholipase family protein [Actinomycetota bacterium]